ncbi:DUF4232 domain-containing protein [Actinacidiphila acididurans]|uniref:DUF4232 domain-containing protein n=1 Tax=Actinacidiphila acididurans TaxID=2784346 RepID=A0ABS2TTE6_9ACTN|nr:DUF4232 domain-containing protein [Actinacidiphila acididurans]MBM9506599.1 DUF4232 domain-containing protein [Actinacidiphila acididurans]
MASPGEKPGQSHGQVRENNEDRFATTILLRNTGNSRCVLNGWPGIVFYGYDVITTCEQNPQTPSCPPGTRPAERRNIRVTRSQLLPPSDIALAPGQTTSFLLLWISTFAQECVKGIVQPYRVEISVPGDSHPLSLAHPALQPCDDVEVTSFGSALSRA